MKKTFLRKSLVWLIVGLFLATSVIPVSGLGIKKVSPMSSSSYNGWDIIVPEDYLTIQEAVDNAETGNRILVKSGLYYENIVISVQNLTLHGESREFTIVNGGGNGHVVSADVNTDGLNISGFTFCSSDNHFTGLYLYSDSSYVKDVVCVDCNIGVALRDNKDNIVMGNKFVSNNYGIWTWMCTNSTFEDNVIENNSLDGLALQSSTNINIMENDIKNNSFNGVLELSCSGINFVDNNIDFNDYFGLQMFSSKDNTVEGNNLESNIMGGISLYKSTNNKIFDNNILHNDENGVSFWFLSSDNRVYGCNISSNFDYGILLKYSFNNTIINCNIAENLKDGILLQYSDENSISNCVIKDHTWSSGVLLEDSDETIIQGCYLSKNMRGGIKFNKNSNNNTIAGCHIHCNSWGVDLTTSELNKVEKCAIANNIYGGILEGQNNTICRNNFINNYNHYYHGDWNDGNVFFRNYWSGRLIQSCLPYRVFNLKFDWLPKAIPYNYSTYNETIPNDPSIQSLNYRLDNMYQEDLNRENACSYLRDISLDGLSSLFSKACDVPDRSSLYSRFDGCRFFHNSNLRKNLPNI